MAQPGKPARELSLRPQASSPLAPRPTSVPLNGPNCGPTHVVVTSGSKKSIWLSFSQTRSSIAVGGQPARHPNPYSRPSWTTVPEISCYESQKKREKKNKNDELEAPRQMPKDMRRSFTSAKWNGCHMAHSRKIPVPGAYSNNLGGLFSTSLSSNRGLLSLRVGGRGTMGTKSNPGDRHRS